MPVTRPPEEGASSGGRPAGEGGTPDGTSRREHPARADLSDRDLLCAHLNKDRFALEVLFLRHRAGLWHVTMRMLRHHHDAEEALQETLTRAWMYAGTYRGDASVKTWLHRIAMNVARSFRARRPQGGDLAQVEDDRADPAAGLALDEVDVNTDLGSDLAKVPPMLREAFVLSAYIGLTHHETAEVLGISVGTVKSREWRARRHLLVIRTARGETGSGNS